MLANSCAQSYHSFLPAHTEQPSIWEKAVELKNKITSHESFSKSSGYAATITLIALAVIFSPSCAIGIGYSLVDLSIQLPIAYLITTQLESSSDPNKVKDEYSDMLENTNPFIITTLIPVVEEGLFRGILQPLLFLGANYTLPAITLELFGGIQMKLASVIAILATSIIFGALHITNNHAYAYYQAGLATIGGIGLGVLAKQWGLLFSTVAHMSHNTIVLGIGDIAKYFTSSPENP